MTVGFVLESFRDVLLCNFRKSQIISKVLVRRISYIYIIKDCFIPHEFLFSLTATGFLRLVSMLSFIFWLKQQSVKCQAISLRLCVLHTSNCVSLCASRLWICLAMELNTSCKSAPSVSTSSSHWSGSTTRGSWVTCNEDHFLGLYDKINTHLGHLTQNSPGTASAVWIPSICVQRKGKEK